MPRLRQQWVRAPPGPVASDGWGSEKHPWWFFRVGVWLRDLIVGARGCINIGVIEACVASDGHFTTVVRSVSVKRMSCAGEDI